jgi:aspartyl-tRNA(Asn)/glutamyl-tRNA(Gln) amidotransferase subunit B
MRSKEDAHDYRYFPDPDLVPIVLEESWIEELKKQMPTLPGQRLEKYTKSYGLPLNDATILVSSKKISDLFEETIEHGASSKTVCNWILVELFKLLKDKDLKEINIPISPYNFAGMLKLIDNGTINTTVAKKVFEKMFNTGEDPHSIVKNEGLLNVSDESLLISIVEEVLGENGQSVEDFRSGKEKAFAFLVGQCMKKSKGKADPKILNKLLMARLLEGGNK